MSVTLASRISKGIADLRSLTIILNPPVLRLILRDPDRKSVRTILREASAFYRAKGEVPHRYVHCLLYRKGSPDPAHYLSRAEYLRLRRLLEPSETRHLLSDKVTFQLHFQDVPGVRLPAYLGHVENGIAHLPDGRQKELGSSDSLDEVLGHAFDLSGGEAIFVKDADGSEGKGIFKLTSPTSSPELLTALKEGKHVFQEAVVQHHALAAVVPDTLNTMRINTCRLRGEPHVATAWIRFGRAGDVVDNASAGGLFAGVDLASGSLTRRTLDKFSRGAGTFTHHPDTGHPLLGFTVPLFAEALEMALAAARHLPHPLVGWDIAISPDGPVIIEGNGRPMIDSDETVNGGYLGHPVFGPFIAELTGGRGLRVPPP